MFRKISWLNAFQILLLSFSVSAFAQQSKVVVTGELYSNYTKLPLVRGTVVFPELDLETQTDQSGRFRFDEMLPGQWLMRVLSSEGKFTDSLQVYVPDSLLTDLGKIAVRTHEQTGGNVIPSITLEDADQGTNEDGVREQSVSSILLASSDPFVNAAAFSLGQYRFQPRGNNRDQQLVYVNNMLANDLRTGAAYWSVWGGLNDMFRSSDQVYGIGPSDFSFGGSNGSLSIDATAAAQSRSTRVSYATSNRQYRNRLMVTHNSGMMENGWAYSLSFSRRWAREGYVPGTFYNGYSYFAGISKEYRKHVFSLTAFGAPVKRGKAYPATQEAYDLAGSNFYNSNWGYQNGEVRNARVADNHQSVFILNHEFRADPSTVIHTSVGYQTGRNGNSSLDWYNARDPRPDYYRNLPEWELLQKNPGAADMIRKNWREQPELYAQIDWDRLYQSNYSNVETVYNVDGIPGNDVTGKRSVYVIGEDVEKIRKYSFQTRVEKKIGERLFLHGGFMSVVQNMENYRELADLLGGDFYLNLNQFAVRQNVGVPSFGQYDVNNPDRLIREGDIYRYHYLTRYSRNYLWSQAVYKTARVDYFLAVNGAVSSFFRDGKYRSGLFEDDSYGKSRVHSFTTYGVKGGATLKIDGRNYMFINAGRFANPPSMEHTFISARTRNQAFENPVTQKTNSLEAGYIMRTPGVNLRVTGYVNDVKDDAEIKRFYNDDPEFQTFVNYALRGINRRYIGTEWGVSARIYGGLSLKAAAAFGQAFYTSNPTVSIYRDNDTITSTNPREVYIRNYYVAAGPQTALNIGLDYRGRRSWFANLDFNYFDRNYIDINPDRRTAESADLIGRGTPLYNKIFGQEKLPAAFTVDAVVYKSFRLDRLLKNLPSRTYLMVHAGVNNILNNTRVITGGFEQLRYDFAENNPDKFPAKYFYGYGRNYFISCSIRF